MICILLALQINLYRSWLNQGMDCLREMKQPLTLQSTGTFFQWVTTDVLKEEGDLVKESGFQERAVRKAIGDHAKGWFKTALEQKGSA